MWANKLAMLVRQPKQFCYSCGMGADQLCCGIVTDQLCRGMDTDQFDVVWVRSWCFVLYTQISYVAAWVQNCIDANQLFCGVGEMLFLPF